MCHFYISATDAIFNIQIKYEHQTNKIITRYLMSLVKKTKREPFFALSNL